MLSELWHVATRLCVSSSLVWCHWSKSCQTSLTPLQNTPYPTPHQISLTILLEQFSMPYTLHFWVVLKDSRLVYYTDCLPCVLFSAGGDGASSGPVWHLQREATGDRGQEQRPVHHLGQGVWYRQENHQARSEPKKGVFKEYRFVFFSVSVFHRCIVVFLTVHNLPSVSAALVKTEFSLTNSHLPFSKNKMSYIVFLLLINNLGQIVMKVKKFSWCTSLLWELRKLVVSIQLHTYIVQDWPDQISQKVDVIGYTCVILTLLTCLLVSESPVCTAPIPWAWMAKHSINQSISHSPIYTGTMVDSLTLNDKAFNQSISQSCIYTSTMMHSLNWNHRTNVQSINQSVDLVFTQVQWCIPWAGMTAATFSQSVSLLILYLYRYNGAFPIKPWMA